MPNPADLFAPSADPLPSYADVQRAIVRTIRHISQGKCKPGKGQVMINALGTLAKVMRENQTDEILERLKRIEASQAAH